jgi:hypothetical protein
MSNGRPWPCATSLRALLEPLSGRFLSAIAIVLTVAGCAGVGSGVQPVAQMRSGPVVFDSVEGVPPEVFHRFVRLLNEEAAARQIAVTTRGNEAGYRIRGYLALDAGRSALDWAWDVYDADQQRVLRLSGEEPADAVTRRAWSAANDQLLRRIAQASLQQLAAFMASDRAAPGTAPAPERNAPAVALLDDFGPEAAGIFRIFTKPEPAPPPADVHAELAPEQVPLPRRRPGSAGRNPAAVAFATER